MNSFFNLDFNSSRFHHPPPCPPINAETPSPLSHNIAWITLSNSFNLWDYANELLLEVTTTTVRSEWVWQSATIDTLGLHICVGRPAQPMHQMEAHYDFIGSFTLVRRSCTRVVSTKLSQSSRAIMVTPPRFRTLLKKTRAQLNPLPHSSPVHDTKRCPFIGRLRVAH